MMIIPVEHARFLDEMRPLLLALLVLLVGCAADSDRALRVGRISRAFTDTTRPNWTNDGPRPLATTVWYPAAPSSVEMPHAIGVFRFGRSAPDAPFVDAQRRPLIVLSHGTGGSAAQLAWLAEALVQDGFVVAAVSHHGNTAAEAVTSPAGFVLPWERAFDLSRLIDRLLADVQIGPHLDSTRIGAAGFSLGGYTVLALGGAHLDAAAWRTGCAAQPDGAFCALPPEASFTLADIDSIARSDVAFAAAMQRNAASTTDPRVRALFAMAPALVPRLDTASLRGIVVPMRIILGERDDQVIASVTRTALSQYVSTAEVQVESGVGHYTFLAACTLRGRVLMRAVCRDAAANREDVHAAVSRDAADFFRAHLVR
jgi:predicted dienelactone hydrolase